MRLGSFESVDLEKVDHDAERRRVRPNLVISPGPKIEVKAVEAKISHGALKKNIPVFQEHAVNNDLLAEGKRNLTEYFQSRGYYDVDVDIRSMSPVNDLQTIDYVISEGPRYKLMHLSFKGNHYFRDDALRVRMFMQPASFLILRHGRYSEAFRRKDEENITDLYRSNGFRDVKVHTVVDRNYQGKAGQVGVTVEIDEGAQWIVDKVALNGMNQFRPEELAGWAALLRLGESRFPRARCSGRCVTSHSLRCHLLWPRGRHCSLSIPRNQIESRLREYEHRGGILLCLAR